MGPMLSDSVRVADLLVTVDILPRDSMGGLQSRRFVNMTIILRGEGRIEISGRNSKLKIATGGLGMAYALTSIGRSSLLTLASF